MRIFCRKCKAEIGHHIHNFNCCFEIEEAEGIFSFINKEAEIISEEITRDRQAEGYLQHVKIQSQSKFFQRFVSELFNDVNQNAKTVLDIGCGPGPTVKILSNFNYNEITAIDFSKKSLVINLEENKLKNNIQFIQADLQHLLFESNSVDILIMSDFIQHVGSFHDKISLIQSSLQTLKPGGRFYLSFFNFNLVNYLKGDLHGSFANGTIPYERLIPSEIINHIRDLVSITRAYPMNITHKFELDNLLGRISFSRYIARMYALEGIRI